MEKRLLAAVTISIAFLLLWTAVAPKLFPDLARRKQPAKPAEKTPSTSATAVPSAVPETPPAPAGRPVAAAAPSTAPAAETPASEIRTVVDYPNYRAVFSNRGGVLISFQLKSYKEKNGKPVELVKPREASRIDDPFALVSTDSAWNEEVNSRLFHVSDRTDRGRRLITYEGRDSGGFVVRKQFVLGPEYFFSFRSDVARPRLEYRVAIGPGIREIDASAKDSQFLRTGNGIIQVEGSYDVIGREKAAGFRIFDRADFVGIEDNYFLAVLKPKQGGAASFKSVDFPSGSKDEPVRRELYAAVNAVNGVVDTSVYFGPKETELLDDYGFERVASFGFFGAIARVCLVGLKWVNQYTHNYGWAIVVLTIFIKILLFPLQWKSIVSMKKMQKVQPKMNAIKERYRGKSKDPEQRQKMNLEMMKLYQQEGISPMSGCLPILLQLPILWAFYELLSQAIELRGAPWILWITDLAQKDPYYITPILMTATMFIQQWITPSAMDPVQKKVLMMMPLIFGWIFKEFPSGLVLYWLVQNVLTIIQQLIMNRFWKD